MANPQFKGRQKGDIKSKTLIEDPLLGDFKISIDDNCYNLIYTDPKTKSEKTTGYFTNLSNALFSICKQQALGTPNYTLKEYAKQIETNFNTLTNSIKL
jgi:hypothetical protein